MAFSLAVCQFGIPHHRDGDWMGAYGKGSRMEEHSVCYPHMNRGYGPIGLGAEG